MERVSVTLVGKMTIVHRDHPSQAEARRRVQILLMGRLPRDGVVEAWRGDAPNEVRWRRLHAS
jgi:hypothetical protein